MAQSTESIRKEIKISSYLLGSRFQDSRLRTGANESISTVKVEEEEKVTQF